MTFPISIKTTKTVLLSVLVALSASTLGACSDDDGDWAPMKWKEETFFDKHHQIKVPAEGGTYTLTCKNYDPWLEMIKIGDHAYEHLLNDSPILPADWLSARADEERKVQIEVSANTSGSWRAATIYITAGDIFDTFIVQQDAE